MSDMKLPEGKTCRDCGHFKRCAMLFSANTAFPSSTSCDWSPSRFVEPVRATPRPEQSTKAAVLAAFDALAAASRSKGQGEG